MMDRLAGAAVALADYDEVYRRRWLNRYGIGIPFVYAFLAVSLYLGAAPGLGTFATQNRYARLGIVVMVGLSVLFLIAAGYDLRRLEYEWKFSKQDAPDDGEDR